MKKFWKWVGIVLGVLAGLFIISLVVVYFKDAGASYTPL